MGPGPRRPTPRRGLVPPVAILAGAIALGTGALLVAIDRLAGEAGPPGDEVARAAPSPGDAAPGTGDAEAHLAAGELLAARNAPGVSGASRDGLLQAEAELTAALRLGCARRADAERLRASTWSALAEQWAESDDERRRYEQRAREALREVVELSPGDASARIAYARALPDAPLRVAELREAARLSDRDGEVRRVLGVELIESGQLEEGARQLVEASRLLDREALQEHGATMLSLLHASSRAEEEARVRERIEQLGL